MATDHSFDVVSKVNLQELRNAVVQAQKELGTRFDFRGSHASIVFEESPPVLQLTADHAAQLNSVTEVMEAKLAKRGVSVKAFSWSPPNTLPSGIVKQQAALQQGLSSEKAKEIVNTVKALGLKIQPRIEGDAVRISGRQRDDLQSAIRALQDKDFGIPIQMENYR